MSTRQQQSRNLRRAAADLAADRPHPRHANNGEEFLYRDYHPDNPSENHPTYLASFTKGLPHNVKTGLVDLEGVSEDPFALFVLGIQSGRVDDFRRTPLGPPKYQDKLGSGSIDYSKIWESTMAKNFEKPDDCSDKLPKMEKAKSLKARSYKGDGEKGAKVRAWESAGAGHVYSLQGPDAQAVTMPPAPRLDEPELIAEMAEVYGMALLRDVPFSRFRKDAATDGKVQKMLARFKELDWFQRVLHSELDPPPRLRHRSDLDLSTLFRGLAPGDNVGPYLSQFLLIGNTHLQCACGPEDGYIQYGAIRIDQRVRFAEPELDYMTTYEQWIDVQNGADLRGSEDYKKDTPFRFMTTPRDLATYVHYDALYEAYLNACLIMLGMGVPFDRGIPFQVADNVDRQQGFAHFGGPHILSLVTEVATRALKAVRYQKFNVHRRARPEAIAGLIHLYLQDARVEKQKDKESGKTEKVWLPHEDRSYLLPLKPLVNALHPVGEKNTLLDEVAKHNAAQNKAKDRRGDKSAKDKCYLLPMAFPEGSPMHPAYGAGHATVAGACVTVLKAYFDHGFPLSDALGGAYEAKDHEAKPQDESKLQKVSLQHGEKLTVEGELNKLAANISIGRDWAGVHYYTDYIESLRMGEQIALGILEEQKLTYHENFTMTVPLFSGEVVRI